MMFKGWKKPCFFEIKKTLGEGWQFKLLHGGSQAELLPKDRQMVWGQKEGTHHVVAFVSFE